MVDFCPARPYTLPLSAHVRGVACSIEWPRSLLRLRLTSRGCGLEWELRVILQGHFFFHPILGAMFPLTGKLYCLDRQWRLEVLVRNSGSPLEAGVRAVLFSYVLPQKTLDHRAPPEVVGNEIKP